MYRIRNGAAVFSAACLVPLLSPFYDENRSGGNLLRLALHFPSPQHS